VSHPPLRSPCLLEEPSTVILTVVSITIVFVVPVSVEISDYRSTEATLGPFFRRVRSGRLLRPAEEVEYVRRAQNGDIEARNRLLEANLRLVVWIAKRYVRRGPTLPDLIQAGSIALVRAVQQFDPRRGFRFSTYATWIVRRAILEEIVHSSSLLWLPSSATATAMEVVTTERRLEQQSATRPSAEELALELRLPLKRVRQLQAATRPHLSLDAPLRGESGTRLGDLLQDRVSESPDELALGEMERAALRRAVAKLPSRHRMVVKLRFGLSGEEPLTLREIGRRFDLSSERIRQLETEALELLRAEQPAGNMRLKRRI
jgi:RNA polymerase primary sigma factor